MTWEEIHQRRPWGRYPCEELIRFMARHYGLPTKTPDISVLELGCGAGANVWFLKRENFCNITAIDISETAIKKTKATMARNFEPSWGVNLVCADAVEFLRSQHSQTFDCVLDITSVQHMTDMAAVYAECHRVLRPGGLLFAMIASMGSTSASLSDVEIVHRMELHEVEKMFGGWKSADITHSFRGNPGKAGWYGHWCCEVTK